MCWLLGHVWTTWQSYGTEARWRECCACRKWQRSVKRVKWVIE
jgi:hypothetical protein